MLKRYLVSVGQQYATKIAGLGLLLIVTGSGSAIASPTTPTLSAPSLVAELMNYCDEGESLFLEAETDSFWVNICGGDLPHDYVGVSKETGNSIRLPLSDYDKQGTYFEAVNDDTSYLIIVGARKGSFLTVTQGKEEILREPLINW